VVTNYAIEVLDSDRARGVSCFVLFRHDDEAGAATRPMEGQPAVVGHYEDEYVRTQLGWRFKRRKAVAAFMAENQ